MTWEWARRSKFGAMFALLGAAIAGRDALGNGPSDDVSLIQEVPIYAVISFVFGFVGGPFVNDLRANRLRKKAERKQAKREGDSSAG
jgi:hypothetical protein